MGMELINRMTIKKDGVYLSSHSSNDSSPFTSFKCRSLTDTYNTEGIKALNKEIIKMLYEYAQTRGNHKSVLKYQEAINNPKSRQIYKKYMDLIDNKYSLLSDEDKKSQWVIERTWGMIEYLEYERSIRDKMYYEIAELIKK